MRMKRHGNKLTALLLALCMILGLAACGGGDKKGGNADQLSGTVYVPEFIDLGIEVDYINSGCCDGKNVYIVADTNTEEEVTDPETGETYTSYDSKTSIYRIPLDGSGGAVELENYKPAYEFENGDGYYYIESIRAGADGTLWLTEQANIYTYDLPEGFDEAKDDKWDYQTREEKQIQRQLDSTGTELKRTETGDIESKLNARYINSNSVIDDSGNLYVCYSGEDNTEGVAVLDGSGNVLFTLEGNVWDLVRLGNGAVATRYYDMEAQKSSLRAIDVEGRKWGDDYPLSGSANSFHDGAGEYLFYYDSGDSLYGYKEGSSGEGEKLLSWSAADINIDNVEFFSFLEDGRIAAMTRSWGRNSGSKTELAVLKAADASVLADKTIMSFACMYLDQELRNSIIDFNKASDKYRIEIRDYSEYNTSDDYQAGLTKLNTEIIAGNVPDIISTYGLSLQRYAAKGYLEDLWPMIDADPDISRESLMENVFKAAEINGKLYQVFDSFAISTAIGSVKVVGDRMGWTLKDLQDALATMPDGCAIFGDYDTQSDMLNTLMAMNLDSYVDWESGESHFDNDQFKAVLEFCKNFPAEIDYNSLNSEEREDEPTRIANGRQMLQTMHLSGFGDIQMYEAMFGGSEALQTLSVNYGSGSGGTYVVTSSVGMSTSDDPFSRPSQRVKPGKYISYVGYPREDGGVGSCFNVYQGLAISSTCKDKDGAWSFVRQQLLPSTDDNTHGYWYFPSNKADFDKVAAAAMEKEYITDENGKNVLDENGNPVEETKSGWGWGSLSIDIVATTQEEYDQIMELYSAVDSLQSYDMNLFEIVADQAGPYFAGDKDLDETVKNIQDRVNLYINENR